MYALHEMRPRGSTNSKCLDETNESLALVNTTYQRWAYIGASNFCYKTKGQYS